ncbi:MAG: hypothetical protein M1831_002995 [Alyxoria varia]|nr:MAG: hypothetical protein M1831_002995 [Alyxoria varia]
MAEKQPILTPNTSNTSEPNTYGHFPKDASARETREHLSVFFYDNFHLRYGTASKLARRFDGNGKDLHECTKEHLEDLYDVEWGSLLYDTVHTVVDREMDKDTGARVRFGMVEREPAARLQEWLERVQRVSREMCAYVLDVVVVLSLVAIFLFLLAYEFAHAEFRDEENSLITIRLT